MASEVVETVFDGTGPLYLDFHPAKVGPSGTYTDGVGCFLVQVLYSILYTMHCTLY
jgi:hypothetical protein